VHTRRLMGGGAVRARALQQLRPCANGDARSRLSRLAPWPALVRSWGSPALHATHTLKHTHTHTPPWGEAPRRELLSTETKA